MAGVCHAMKIATAESKPDMELLAQQIFCFSPGFVAGDDKVPVMIM